MRDLRTRFGRWSVAAALGLSLWGCTSDAVEPEPIRNPPDLYWRLTLNERAVNLSTVAPYDTFRLVATPRTADGRPIEGLPAPTFVSSDSDRVAVSSEGVLYARRSANRVKVMATLNAGSVTHSDSAFVSVITSAPPVVTRLELEPAVPDSTRWTVYGGIHYPEPSLTARAFDAAGRPLTSPSIWIESSNPKVAWYRNSNRELLLPDTGAVTFYASMVAYGMPLRDTLEFVVTLPLSACFRPEKLAPFGSAQPTYRFVPTAVTVSQGAYVWWNGICESGLFDEDFDVTFDDPTHVAEDTLICRCGAGNITNFDPIPFPWLPPDQLLRYRIRHFPVPGTYTFRSERLGVRGTIHVVGANEGTSARLTSPRPLTKAP